MQIFLKYGERKIPVQITEQKSLVSKHTGRALDLLSGEVVARGEEARQILVNLIRQGDEIGLPSSDAEGSPGKTWRVRETYSSYRSGPQPVVCKCNWELEEFENRTAKQLIIGPLSLVPYQYNETAEDEGLTISASVSASVEEGKTLRELLREPGYHEVRRIGISDDPRRMRFGRTLWSSNDGKEKYQLCLVDESWDKAGRKAPNFYPELSNIMGDLARQMGRLQAMADLLLHKGIINREELDGIEQQARDGKWERVLDFFKMDDIDAM